MSPEDLILQAKNGDRPALTRLLMDHRGLVASVTTRLISDNEGRKDVVQNIFIKVINQVHSFAERCKFSTWLYRIAVNECIEHGRRRSRARLRTAPFADESPAALDPNAPDALTAAGNAELRDAVMVIIKTLPIDQKTAFSLFYFGGYTGKEGAEALSISEPNFFMKLKAARDAVKQGLIAKGWSL